MDAVTAQTAIVGAGKGADADLRAAAAALETEFLTEMLKAAGFGEARESFGGGVGEEQFTSFLQREQAAAMVRGGGIGLSESIFEALTKGTVDAR
jgi:Rod binding domain-containing protein